MSVSLSKRKHNLSIKDFKSLKLFRQDYPVARCYLLYGGDRHYIEDDIQVIPFNQALLSLAELLF